MENTTKMLLIVAAVLIVIVLVTFGIKIISSIKDTSVQVSVLGESIQDHTKRATSSAIEGINSGADFCSQNVITPEKFNSEVFKILKMNSN